MDGFTAIAEPSRRLILERLRDGERDVGALVDDLGMSQPLISKHLRVLRDVGVVTSTVAGRRRVYRLSAQPLPDVVEWVAPFREMWSSAFDRLSAEMAADAPSPVDDGEPARRRSR